jgi:hypothetical protein
VLDAFGRPTSLARMAVTKGSSIMRIMLGMLILAVLVVVMSDGHVQSSASPNVASLAGLEGVSLYVADTDSGLHDRGITAKGVEAAASIVLRDAGVPLLNQGDPGRSDGNPILVIDVMGIVGPAEDECTYSIQVELMQDVQLTRDDIRLEMVPTWRIGGIAHVGRDWRKLILADVQFYTRGFVDAYYTAGGK